MTSVLPASFRCSKNNTFNSASWFSTWRNKQIEQEKWNFRYYGNEMLKWHKWQCAIFTSLNKLRIIQPIFMPWVILSLTFKKKKWRNKFLMLGVTRENLLNQKTSKERNWPPWGERDHKPRGLLTEEWEHCFLVPPTK